MVKKTDNCDVTGDFESYVKLFPPYHSVLCQMHLSVTSESIIYAKEIKRTDLPGALEGGCGSYTAFGKRFLLFCLNSVPEMT